MASAEREPIWDLLATFYNNFENLSYCLPIGKKTSAIRNFQCAVVQFVPALVRLNTNKTRFSGPF